MTSPNADINIKRPSEEKPLASLMGWMMASLLASHISVLEWYWSTHVALLIFGGATIFFLYCMAPLFLFHLRTGGAYIQLSPIGKEDLRFFVTSNKTGNLVASFANLDQAESFVNKSSASEGAAISEYKVTNEHGVVV